MSAACDACLRRGALLGLLAPSIAGLLERPRERAASLLSLGMHMMHEARSEAAALAALAWSAVRLLAK